jgi:ABC-type polysaccharide/polyol phosphate export permease
VQRYGAPDLRRGLQVQLRVIHALLMREVITRFGRHNLGVLWLIGEPMLFTMGVASLWSLGGFGHSSTLPIVPFAVTGYTTVLMWRNTVGRCTPAIPQNLNLLYHRNVKVIDILLTRAVLECLGAVSSFAILSSVLVAGGWMEMPEDFLKIMSGLVLLGWFALGLGLLVGAAASLSELIERIWHPLAYILMPLSGAPYMVDWLPATAREYVLMLPMVHCLELLREGYFGRVVQTHYDLGYVVVFNTILTLMGLFMVRFASRRVEGL